MDWVGKRFQRVHDWVMTYDPAQGNLRLACRVLLSILLAVGLIILLGRLTHYPVMSLAVAVVIAMNTSSAVRDPQPRARRMTMLLVPLPAALSVTLAAFLRLLPLGGEIGFVLIACTSVYIRRFGPRGFAFGMVSFMSYFFGLFTAVLPASLHWVYVALVIGALCSLLSYLLLPDLSSRRTLGASLEAFRGRLRQHVAGCLGAMCSSTEAARRAVLQAEARLNEATLAASEQIGAFSEVSGAGELTAHLLDLELSARRLVRGVLELPAGERDAALRDLERLLHWTLAGRGGRPWQPDERTPAPLRHELGALTKALMDLRAFDIERLEPRSDKVPPGPKPAKPAGMSLSTRQALQAALACALAILGGELISSARWYWAVIAAFIVFTGTSTRGEVFVRGWLRVIGTLAGVVVGVLLATLLHGNLPLSLVLIMISVFLAFYLIRLSNALMVFHITVVLALVYGLTGTFSPGLLELRLAETAYGAVAGMLAAAFLLPTATHGQLQLELQAFFRALAGLFGDLSAQLRKGQPLDTVSVRSLELAQRYQLLSTAALPLTRNPFRGSWQQSVAHQLQLIGALEYEVGGLLQNLRAGQALPTTGDTAVILTDTLDALQRRAEALAQGRTAVHETIPAELESLDGGPYAELAEHLRLVGDRLGSLDPASSDPIRGRSTTLSPA